MLVWKITTFNEDTGKKLKETGWEAVPTEAQESGAYRLLTAEYGRAIGKILDAKDARKSYGWKLHQIRSEGARGSRYNHVAVALIGWRQGNKVLAYDTSRNRPLPGTDADKVQLSIPEGTQYPGQTRRWKERSPPADATPSRVPRDRTEALVREVMAELVRINLEQARGDRTPKSAAEALENLLHRIQAA